MSTSGERILLTGCTGFVGKFVLRELAIKIKTKQTTVICLLRGKKGQTANDRWSAIKASSLYSHVDLSRVIVQEGDLDTLESIVWPSGAEPTLILHCAANVKTLDSYENLYRDNVLGVESLCQAALTYANKPRLLLVSTCYVHPRGTVGKPELLTKGLPKDLFTTDYTYTKYLGEHVAASFTDRLQISLLRLSCVGAPFGWLDAHPTPAAMAHLGIVSLVLRGKLEQVRVPSTMRLSTIPVDIVARSIVDEVQTTQSALNGGIIVKQICAAPDSVWNLSMSRLYKAIHRLAPNISLQIQDTDKDSFERNLTAKLGYSIYTPWGAKNLIFHKEVNRFIDKFADGQCFESTVPLDYFPSIPEESIYEQTCLYVARGNHQHLLEKGFAMPPLDKFWATMPEHTVQTQFIYREPIVFKSKEEAEEQIMAVFSSYRLAYTEPNSKFFKYDASMGPLIGWTYDEVTMVSRAYRIQIVGTYDNITGLKMLVHHGIGDGMAHMKHVLPRLDSLGSQLPRQTIEPPSAKPKPLSMTEELMCFIFYFCLLVKLVFSPLAQKPSSSENKTVEMATAKLQKDPGTSFTVSLLKRSYPSIRAALKRDTIVYCIPAAIEGPDQRGLSMPRNSFVPIIIPWSIDGGLIQEQLLRSKAVKALSSLIGHIISITEFHYLRDLFLEHVDVVYSSLLATDSPLQNIKSVHFLSPSPSSIPFSICAGTVGSETHLTVASTLDTVPASKIIAEILRT